MSTTGSTISQNSTYIRNPGFPTAYSTSGSLSYTVAKSTSGIFLLFYFEVELNYILYFTSIGPLNIDRVSYFSLITKNMF